jgi:hypothetical protein
MLRIRLLFDSPAGELKRWVDTRALDGGSVNGEAPVVAACNRTE